jgi:hypothetical protein
MAEKNLPDTAVCISISARHLLRQGGFVDPSPEPAVSLIQQMPVILPIFSLR